MPTPDTDVFKIIDRLDEIEETITSMAQNQPRNLQTQIGPSEIGTACVRCLCLKLAGYEKEKSDSFPWSAWIGTCCHRWLEQEFKKLALRTQNHDLLTEVKIPVGEIDGTQCVGSCDLYDSKKHVCVDWKFAGTTMLKKYASGNIPRHYEVQAHLYAKGLNDLGMRCDWVSICFFPRTQNSWKNKVWWIRPYNQEIALQALQRANYYKKEINKNTCRGLEYFKYLPTATGCISCKDYEYLFETQQKKEHSKNG